MPKVATSYFITKSLSVVEMLKLRKTIEKTSISIHLENFDMEETVWSYSWSSEVIHNQPPAQGFSASRNSIWLETYLSDMHPCKEVLITFMQNDNFTTRPIVLGNSTDQCVTAYKLLGIIVINDLKYNEHIDYRSKKASKRLYSLRILKKVRVN